MRPRGATSRVFSFPQPVSRKLEPGRPVSRPVTHTKKGGTLWPSEPLDKKKGGTFAEEERNRGKISRFGGVARR